ncbi:MAG: hypothetical protein U0610_31120 [bacterium]
MATLGAQEHLDKTYSTGRQALVDVCLTVADGELLWSGPRAAASRRRSG